MIRVNPWDKGNPCDKDNPWDKGYPCDKGEPLGQGKVTRASSL